MADEELTLDPVMPPPADEPPSSNGSDEHDFDLDEQTLGRAASVFDAGVDLMPPMVAPAPPMPMAEPVDPEPVALPMSQRERRRRVRLEARRVRRIVRHIEPWSVLKISVIFYFCLWLIFLLSGLLLWSFAESSGTLDSVEDLIESLFSLEAENEFFSGGTIFRNYAIGTLVLSIAGVAFNVLLCVLYNLISDLTGGMRITVIEEESARFQPPRRRRRR
ncbi:MAG: DUF3566 domain-containing protein [Actinomycetota bacterium]